MEDKRYDCKDCINRASPLCSLCAQIRKPSGKDTKPTYYIAQRDIVVIGAGNELYEHPTTDPKTEELAGDLMRLLRLRVPIPTRIVLEYNRRTEKRSS